MQTTTGQLPIEWTPKRVQDQKPSAPIEMRGCIHNIRDMAQFAFLILRRREGVVQCVLDAGTQGIDLSNLAEGASVSVTGTVVFDERAPQGFEIHIKALRVLSQPACAMPVPVHKHKLNLSIENDLDLRPVTLRNLRKRAVFKLQEGMARGFSEFLTSQDFTQIRTPKLVAAGAEGGANIFKLDYFGKRAFLAQSPQFYKQMMVGVFDRVFEIGPVFRAEKHATTRHLNEYISMDLEMGYIDGFEDIMQMEAALLQHTFALLQEQYAPQLALAQVKLPDAHNIPTVRFSQAKEMVAEKYKRRIRDPFDLEPEEEQLISQLFKDQCGADFVFVTHYPSKKRPFYAMDDPEDARYTLSFDLLMHGMEITTGGQRIHDYSMQVEKMQRLGMDIGDFSSYLMAHQHGLPPHGGLGIGLERLTMKLVGGTNIREAALFPRDINRLDP